MKTVTDSIKIDSNIYEANQTIFDNYIIEEDNIKVNDVIYSASQIKGE